MNTITIINNNYKLWIKITIRGAYQRSRTRSQSISRLSRKNKKYWFLITHCNNNLKLFSCYHHGPTKKSKRLWNNSHWFIIPIMPSMLVKFVIKCFMAMASLFMMNPKEDFIRGSSRIIVSMAMEFNLSVEIPTLVNSSIISLKI